MTNTYIFLASEQMNNEDMIALAVNVGRELERIFPGRDDVANARRQATIEVLEIKLERLMASVDQTVV